MRRLSILVSLVLTSTMASGLADAASPRRIVVGRGMQYVCALAVDAENVYWTTTWGEVGKVPKSGTGHPTVLVKESSDRPDACLLRVDAENVYWSGLEGVYRVGKNGGKVATVWSGEPGDRSVPFALAGDAVYVAERGALGMLRVPRYGGAPVQLVTAGRLPVKDDGSAGQTVAVGERDLYWTSGGRLYRVPVAGGAAELLLGGAAGKLVASDAKTLYWAPASPRAAGAAGPKGIEIVVVEPLESASVAGGVLAGVSGDEIRTLSLGPAAGQRLVIDRCPIPKGSAVTDGASVFWSEQPYQYDATNAPKIARVDLAAAGSPRAPAAPPISDQEAATDALRGWLGSLRRREVTTPAAPLSVSLSSFDGEQVKRAVTTADDLAKLADTLRQAAAGGEMKLFDFEERCWDWRPLSGRARRVLPFARALREQALAGAVVLRTHQSYQCPYVEVTAAMRRVNGRYVPTLLLMTSGYDCE